MMHALKPALTACGAVLLLLGLSVTVMAAEPPKPAAITPPGGMVASPTATLAAVIAKMVVPDVAVNLANPKVDLKATLTSATGPMAYKTLIYWVDGRIVGDKLTGADGAATFSFNAEGLSAGNHALTVVFEGDGQYAKAQGKANLIVNKAAAKMNITGFSTKWVIGHWTGTPEWVLYSEGTLEGLDGKPISGNGTLRILVDGQVAKGANAKSSTMDVKNGQFSDIVDLTSAPHTITYEFTGTEKYLSSFVTRQTAAPPPPPSTVDVFFQNDGPGTPSPLDGNVAYEAPITVKLFASREGWNGAPVAGVDVVLRVGVAATQPNTQGPTGIVAEKTAKSGADGYATFTYTVPFYARTIELWGYVNNAKVKSDISAHGKYDLTPSFRMKRAH